MEYNIGVDLIQSYVPFIFYGERLRGKQVRFLCGPATVKEEFLLGGHWIFWEGRRNEDS